MIVELKKTVENHECAIHTTGLFSEYRIANLTTSTIFRNKDATKGADTAKGAVLAKQRTQVEDVGKVLLVRLKEQQLAGDSRSEVMICEEARKLHSYLL